MPGDPNPLLESIILQIEKGNEELKTELKAEFKSIIEASEARILLKIEDVKQRVSILEKENTNLKNKIESLERANRKNNIS